MLWNCRSGLKVSSTAPAGRRLVPVAMATDPALPPLGPPGFLSPLPPAMASVVEPPCIDAATAVAAAAAAAAAAGGGQSYSSTNDMPERWPVRAVEKSGSRRKRAATRAASGPYSSAAGAAAAAAAAAPTAAGGAGTPVAAAALVGASGSQPNQRTGVLATEERVRPTSHCSAMPAMRAGTTSTNTVTKNTTTNTKKSRRSVRYSSSASCTSMRRLMTVMMMAAGTTLGRRERAEVAHSRTGMMSTPAASDAICVRAPDDAMTAVRLKEPVTG